MARACPHSNTRVPEEAVKLKLVSPKNHGLIQSRPPKARHAKTERERERERERARETEKRETREGERDIRRDMRREREEKPSDWGSEEMWTLGRQKENEENRGGNWPE